MELELSYDRLGGRLCAIGDVRITHGKWGGRPQALGPWPLQYDMMGHRLRWIGDLHIGYGRWGNRPRTFGTWDVDCGWSTIPRRVGPYVVGRHGFSGKVRTIGPLAISYDMLGSRPRRIELPKGHDVLPDDLGCVLFLVLHLQAERARGAAAAS
ncbi:hypothetical protein ACIPSA_09155 [Streptomyces sp. NPDC086549]|uniref:hypothetical protein n=1 Tax=Streptomyces sp. NPDC086549 TaxID=3365752 RepID=UPI00382961CC